ncbi:hypothetical protein scyTo_0001227 [Scyliorhinus torazame]|uniref:Uncharacterized protein n=1 Tax=Scyliorhinus torazame TaxID=75743 RepID=A0A401PAU2_SCYTO|nr:hypothetical protein [Scyliorhinus torazame]
MDNDVLYRYMNSQIQRMLAPHKITIVLPCRLLWLALPILEICANLRRRKWVGSDVKHPLQGASLNSGKPDLNK